MSVMPLASSSSGTPTAGLFQNLSTGAVGVVALAVNGRGRTCITTHVVPNAALVCGAAPRAAARSRVTVLAPAHTLQESIALPVYGRRSNAPCSKTIIMLLTTGQVPHAARRDSPFTYEHACISGRAAGFGVLRTEEKQSSELSMLPSYHLELSHVFLQRPGLLAQQSQWPGLA
ncbi:hypothetical protein DHEL01_v205105 [Diaporthe helianthi]|uniref:Uncharacterized protein n=1 Tax=Diaporthe helianthi TaxID=158607 RepID=A0A2P5I1W1_DIAHE|nr:hypothetical protein DHEL01_v205105 [Diaporthe helianthi]